MISKSNGKVIEEHKNINLNIQNMILNSEKTE